MLKVIGFAKEDQACFVTQSKKDVVVVKFADGSFSGTLSWNALLDILKRKAAENEKAKRDAEQATSASITKPS